MTATPLLSRVAESLFWLGRQVERAENTARLLDVAYHGRLEPQGADVVGARNTWEALIATLGLGQAFGALYHEADEASVVEFLTVSRANSSSIVSALASARENARGVRDYLSSETWVAINRLYHATSQRNLHLIMADGLYDFCDMVRQGAHLFDGTAEATCLHDEGWQWMRAGELLERADMVTRIVDSKYHLLMDSVDEVGGPLDRYQWIAVLRSVSGYEAFRRTHASGIEPAAVIEFLLLDDRFPRSARRAVEDLASTIDQATEGAEPRLRNPVMRLVSDLQNRLEFVSADALIAEGLHEFIFETQETLAALNTAVHNAFFWSSASAA